MLMIDSNLYKHVGITNQIIATYVYYYCFAKISFVYYIYSIPGFKQLLQGTDALLGSHKAAFLNDLTVTKDEATVYITVTSTRWHRRDFPYMAAENQPNGR